MKRWRKNAAIVNALAEQKHQGRKNKWMFTLPPTLHDLGKGMMAQLAELNAATAERYKSRSRTVEKQCSPE